MPASTHYASAKITVDDLAWYPVIPPFTATSWSIRNTTGDTLLLRTDTSDASTEDTLAPEFQESAVQSRKSFVAGSPVVFVKASGGFTTPYIIAKFVR